LGPLLFTICKNRLDVNIENARFHFYADVIYCSALTKQEALRDLQSVFDTIQTRFFTLKLVLKLGYTISKIVHYQYPRLDAGYGYIVQS